MNNAHKIRTAYTPHLSNQHTRELMDCNYDF